MLYWHALYIILIQVLKGPLVLVVTSLMMLLVVHVILHLEKKLQIRIIILEVAGILRDKTIADKLMYIFNDDTQNYYL